MSSFNNLQEQDIGAFVLSISGNAGGSFNVTYFELVKSVGTYASCTVAIADATEVVAPIRTSFPKLSSIKGLFSKIVKSQAQGSLADCQLIQYKSSGKRRTWFKGKLCTITPTLQVANGVQTGLQCYCAGKACELQYNPTSDFIFTPASMAKNQTALQKAGVFGNGQIHQSVWAASQKLDSTKVISWGKISINDNVLQMLDKSLEQLLKFQKFSDPQINNIQPKTKLAEYFTCNVYPSKILKLQKYPHSLHPYVQKLVQDFLNGYRGGTVLDAVANALQAQDRYLTFVPPAIGQQDKLKIWPSFIQRCMSSIQLEPQDMLGCSIASNPMQHIRTPTCIYIRSRLLPAFAKDQKPGYSPVKGFYALPGASQPYRLKLLDVPNWVLNVVVQNNSKALNKNTKSGLLNSDAEKKAAIAQTTKELAVNQALLDAYAKTVYFNNYMLDKQANIDLAITQKTIGLDKYVGQSIKFYMPIDASQLGKGTSGCQMFYGRLQNIQYAFKAANSPQGKSSLQISCGLTGVTPQDSPAASLFTDDNKTFIYEIRGK